MPDIRNQPLSLRARLLVVGSLAVAAFLGLTGLTLDKAFRESARTALQDRLQGYVYQLLAAAEFSDDGSFTLPSVLPEPRFATAGSGLYASVSADGTVWRSESGVGLILPAPPDLQQGQFLFAGPVASDVGELYFIHHAIGWERADETVTALVFSVAEDMSGFANQVSSFRRSLWGWLGAAAILLLAVQTAMLHWSLGPLRRVADDLSAIEHGEGDQLAGPYPRELEGLTGNLNALIRSQQLHLERYRNTLADLAHSLKTPLAVLRMTLEKQGDREGLLKQVQRMDDQIGWHLKRAAARGHRPLTAPIDPGPVLRRVAETLARLHTERRVECSVDVAPGVQFRGEEGDLFELAGNLMENAYKWCNERVRVACDGVSDHLELRVEDDGPGIEQERIARLLRRGERGDQRVSGHGLGLAIVNEIVAVYGGTISIEKSSLGGAAVIVLFPSA